MGGSAHGDGLDGVDTHGGNCSILSAEVTETLSPVRVRKTALVPGSGGRGKYRGGLGIRRDYEMLAKSGVLTGYCQQTRDDTAPWGYAGGGPGGKAAMLLNPGTDRERNLGSKLVGIMLERGDVLRLVNSGGGGWGDPAERDTNLIERDRREGLI